MSERTYTDEEAAQVAARRGMPRFVKLALRQEGLSRKAKEEPKFKFYNLYGQVLLVDTLRCAWEQARANKGAAGVNHVTFIRGGLSRLFVWIQAWAECTDKGTIRVEGSSPWRIRYAPRIALSTDGVDTSVAGVPPRCSARSMSTYSSECTSG